jgi:SAM-dependent methyltransferase
VWRISESDLDILGNLRGRRVLELGCGAAQWAFALEARGANCAGLDLSVEQLRHAREHARECSVSPPLVQGDAQLIPFGDATFDVVFCDHGAMTCADPVRVVPEVSRILRDEGLFAFCMSTPIRDMCFEAAAGAFTGRLESDYFTLAPFDDGDSVTAQLPYGEWIRVFRRASFVVEDLVELRAPAESSTTYTEYVPAAWASRWPAEHIWKLRREFRQVGHRT